MPDRRRSTSASPSHRQSSEVDAKREAGERLKRAIHVARARAGLTSDVQVATRSNVSYDTLMNWYSGRTNPRGFELRKVAEALDTSYPLLEGAYNGTDPEPMPLQDAVRDLIRSLDDLVGELRLTRAEQLVSQEMLVDALREVERRGLSREASLPRSRAHRVTER